jgi:hypothetical protein
LVNDFINNLPRDGEYHTYICSHGNTHRVREFKMPYVAPVRCSQGVLGVKRDHLT